MEGTCDEGAAALCGDVEKATPPPNRFELPRRGGPQLLEMEGTDREIELEIGAKPEPDTRPVTETDGAPPCAPRG